MYVFWHLSTSTQSGIVRTGMQEMIARYPRQSATVASLEKKYLALLPLFEKVRRTGRMSGNVARAFKDSLKPAEKNPGLGHWRCAFSRLAVHDLSDGSGNQSGRMAVVVPDGFHISGCPSVSDAAEGPGYRIRHHKTVPGGCHRWIFRHPAGKCAEKSRLRVHLQHQPGVSGTTGNLHPRGML